MRPVKEEEIIKSLEQNREVFDLMLRSAEPELIDWRPAPGKWSLREIVAHLYDEERDDFRTRLLHYIYTPHETLKAIDPEAWVEEREYGKMDYEICLADFLKERNESIAILNGISSEIWTKEYQHAKFGTVGPRFFLTNWLAHDLQHIKQITRQKYEYLEVKSHISLDYAG